MFANSRDVAALFGKQHAHVLRDIRDTLHPNLEPMDFTRMFRHTKVETKVGFGTRMDEAEDMTKDGFTLLVMGYTGAKAMQFKVAYIQAFNEMEAKLKGPQLPDFTNPAAAARAWAGEYEQRQLAQQKVIELEARTPWAASLPAVRLHL